MTIMRNKHLNRRILAGFHGETVTIKPVEIKEKIWQRGEPPRRALHDIVTQFSQIEGRLQKMERYVTSPEFTVAREINKL